MGETRPLVKKTSPIISHAHERQGRIIQPDRRIVIPRMVMPEMARWDARFLTGQNSRRLGVFRTKDGVKSFTGDPPSGSYEAAPPGDCTTANHVLIYNHYATTGDLESIRYSTGDLMAAQIALGATSYTITRYVLYATDVNQSGTLVGALYSDNAGNIGTIIGDTSVAIGHASISDNPTWQAVTFDLPTPKTGVTGTIWVHFTATTDGRFFSYTVYAAGTRSYYAAGYHNDRTITADVYGCSE